MQRKSSELYKEYCDNLSAGIESEVLRWAKNCAPDTTLREVSFLIETMKSLGLGAARDCLGLGVHSKEIDAESSKSAA